MRYFQRRCYIRVFLFLSNSLQECSQIPSLVRLFLSRKMIFNKKEAIYSGLATNLKTRNYYSLEDYDVSFPLIDIYIERDAILGGVLHSPLTPFFSVCPSSPTSSPSRGPHHPNPPSPQPPSPLTLGLLRGAAPPTHSPSPSASPTTSH